MYGFASALTALGVRRPVLIIVINLLIILVGLASIFGLDVRELPNVDRPIISVRADLDGASPKTMDTEVTSILEGAIARVSGVKSIRSASEENNMRIRIELNPGSDVDTAANDVREAVSRAQRQLPDNVKNMRIIKADADAGSIIDLSIYSNTLTKYELAKRVEKEIAPEFLSILGVADVRVEGDSPRVLRVLLRPDALKSYALSINEVIDTLKTLNFDIPAGSYKSQDQELLVRALATVTTPKDIKKIIIKKDIRVGDVADVFYAPKEEESFSLLNGRMVIGLGIIRQAGSNTMSIASEVNKKLLLLNERAKNYTIQKTSDDSLYIKGALSDVLYTLSFAIAIVLLVIALFLGQFRSILIPAVTMPVSLIGTLAVIWFFGFSINLLTLLAMVLATGLIVDDAIVVLENIQRRFNQGLGKMAAAVLGTKQVFFAVISTTITLVSVFLPIAFLPGESGMLFREFALVLAIAVVISSFVSITLCPMMASRLMKKPKNSEAKDTLLEKFGHSFTNVYISSLQFSIRHKYTSIFLAFFIVLAGILGFESLHQELLPKEDRGAIRVYTTGPDGASLNYSNRQSQKVEEVLLPYQENGVITDIYTIVGRWDKNRAYTIATLKDWNQREVSQMQLASEIGKKLTELPGAQVRIRQGNSLGVRGTGSGLEIALLGNSYEELFDAAQNLSKQLRAQIDSITNIRINFNTSQPELSFRIDRQKAHDLGVSMDEISSTLKVMVDRYELVDLNVDDEAVALMLGSSLGSIKNPQDLLNISVLSNSGKMISLSALVSMQEKGVAAQLDRLAQRRSIELDIDIPQDAALGEMVQKVQTVADASLPPQISILFQGEAQTLKETSYESLLTFIMALVVITLVLSAQFESIGSAMIVMFTVPFGLAAAVFALLLSGQSLNLYSQIGLILLIGLMTKNAILLVEFMDQMRDMGKNVEEAVIEGVKVRLRPVVMTVLSTVLGALPLILSTGPAAEARNAIGWVLFGGLGLSALFTLYLTPLGYSLIAPYLKPRAHFSQKLDKEFDEAQKKGLIDVA